VQWQRLWLLIERFVVAMIRVLRFMTTEAFSLYEGGDWFWDFYRRFLRQEISLLTEQ
jgi:hypothetical protein